LSFMEQLKEFGRIHGAMQSSDQCKAHWERNLRQYVHHVELLFAEFTSKEGLGAAFWCGGDLTKTVSWRYVKAEI